METGISSGLMGHLARMQTLPYGDVTLRYVNWKETTEFESLMKP